MHRLTPALNKQIKHRNQLRLSGEFVPNWKDLSTWINQKGWEEEYPELHINGKSQKNLPPKIAVAR